jgi:hypothetical protein
MAPQDACRALKQTWNAKHRLEEIPFHRIQALLGERYSRDDWNLKY